LAALLPGIVLKLLITLPGTLHLSILVFNCYS
jgi:hypothetical protein